MKKIKVKILGLSFSQSQLGSYILVLSEIKGDRKLPIIIKSNEAQYIALKMEGIKTPRPLTQDLFKPILESLGAEVVKVYVHSLVEGVFHAKVIISAAMDTFEIECSVGDAISLSLNYECPIYVSENVLNISGIYMSEDGVITKEQDELNKGDRDVSIVSVEDLEKMLEKAVESEEFEIASQLRDRINQIKEKSSK